MLTRKKHLLLLRNPLPTTFPLLCFLLSHRPAFLPLLSHLRPLSPLFPATACPYLTFPNFLPNPRSVSSLFVQLFSLFNSGAFLANSQRLSPRADGYFSHFLCLSSSPRRADSRSDSVFSYCRGEATDTGQHYLARLLFGYC